MSSHVSFTIPVVITNLNIGTDEALGLGKIGRLASLVRHTSADARGKSGTTRFDANADADADTDADADADANANANANVNVNLNAKATACHDNCGQYAEGANDGHNQTHGHEHGRSQGHFDGHGHDLEHYHSQPYPCATPGCLHLHANLASELCDRHGG